ncbi:hypothetical protein [Pedobacter sp. MR2016-24]|uniref:DUF6712 family protein n=1 Tax=Pedobacter sp. MR2016-24 TaxID=2994466 RepID=UPI00224708A8|nr:hypothetical protein [Pedobacter sp. MR2016-24]MCX2486609.1 hypothetical protein [Pedobacter sp. MR2016-24]
MAKKNILLVSESEVKENSTIEKNVEPKLLNLIISDLQNNELRRLLTSSKYDALIDSIQDFKDNQTPLLASDDELIDEYIKPYLIAATVVQFIVMNNYKLSNKGVLNLTDDNAKDVTSGELEYLKGYYILKQEGAKKNLKDYLKINDTCTDSNDTNNSELGGLYLQDNNNFSYRIGRNKYL